LEGRSNQEFHSSLLSLPSLHGNATNRKILGYVQPYNEHDEPPQAVHKQS
jgi:hypothetical protein